MSTPNRDSTRACGPEAKFRSTAGVGTSAVSDAEVRPVVLDDAWRGTGKVPPPGYDEVIGRFPV